MGLVLSLALSSPSLAGRMVPDPGVVDHVATPVATTDLLVAPGAWARLDMTLGEYRIEVVSGEVSVVFTADRRTITAGDTRVIPAGTAFGLLNSGAQPAHLRISLRALPPAGS